MDDRYTSNYDMIFSENLQNILLTKIISIIGCGGQGSYIAEFVTRLGINTLHLWDGDIYERSNLNRQNGSFENNIGENKAFSLSKKLKEINSSINIEPHDWYFGEYEKQDFDIINNSDFIFLCFDTSQNIFKARQLIRYAIELGTPAIDCPVNDLGGFIIINTNKDFSHYDNYTQKLNFQKLQAPASFGTAYKCALIAAEAVNAMVQYFDEIRFAPVNSKLDIDIYHHKYIESDKYSTFNY